MIASRSFIICNDSSPLLLLCEGIHFMISVLVFADHPFRYKFNDYRRLSWSHCRVGRACRIEAMGMELYLYASTVRSRYQNAMHAISSLMLESPVMYMYLQSILQIYINSYTSTIIGHWQRLNQLGCFHNNTIREVDFHAWSTWPIMSFVTLPTYQDHENVYTSVLNETLWKAMSPDELDQVQKVLRQKLIALNDQNSALLCRCCKLTERAFYRNPDCRVCLAKMTWSTWSEEKHLFPSCLRSNILAALSTQERKDTASRKTRPFSYFQNTV